jgi:hypothetical protein
MGERMDVVGVDLQQLAAIQAAIACSNDSLRRMLLGYQAAKTSMAVARLAGSCVLSAAWKLSYSAGLAKLERAWPAASSDGTASASDNTRTTHRNTINAAPIFSAAHRPGKAVTALSN